MDPKMTRQEALEAQMLSSGRERFEQQIQDAIADGRLSETSTGLKIIRAAREVFARDLDAALSRTGQHGPLAQADAYLGQVSSDEIAHVVLRVTLNKAHDVSFQTVADAVAEAVTDHVDSRVVPEKAWASFGKQGVPVNRMQWDEDKKLGVATLSQLLEAAGGLLLTEQKRANKTDLLNLSPEVQEVIDAAPELASIPRLLPCVVPPKPWVALGQRATGGGYHTPALQQRLPMMKRRTDDYLEDLRHVEMPAVVEALNTVQATAWRINRPVYDVMAVLAQDEQKAALDVAGMFLGNEAIYFPHTMDWRGRMYAAPVGLNVQMGDPERGLLTFAQGQPITTSEAADWLAIHGANVYGVKGSLADRVKWVQDNQDMILAIASDPLGDRRWREADGGDGRWQFLAFCFEWAAFVREGFGYVSSLPVGMDGTCNGLQHFAAMMRDEAGGRAVNLLPGERQDVYQDVAEAVTKRLEAEAQDSRSAYQAMAATWLAIGVTRKLVKPAVMTTPYGASSRTRRTQVKTAIVARYGPDFVSHEAIAYLVRHVSAVINTTLPSAREAMAWLKKVAQATAKKGLPVMWQTPAGLWVVLMEPERESVMIRVRARGKLHRRTYSKPIPGTLDTAQQVSGISPDFVHSLDAAHLMLTVNAARARGVANFAMVHDCYGTTAAEAATLAACLRETFVATYQEQDVLAELRAGLFARDPDLKIPAPPERGSLDVSQVLRSDYFFS